MTKAIQEKSKKCWFCALNGFLPEKVRRPCGRKASATGCPYKRNSAKMPKRSPAVQAAGRKRGDERGKNPVKNAVHTCEKRVRSKRIKIIEKRC